MGVIRRLQKGNLMKTTIEERLQIVMTILTSPEFSASPREQFLGLYRWYRVELAVVRLKRAKANLRKQDRKLDAALDPLIFRGQLDKYL